jgi:pimeloyl-ACP methyl ester carboxylesterase
MIAPVDGLHGPDIGRPTVAEARLLASEQNAPAGPFSLVMLPGLDGIGKRFGRFIEALGAQTSVTIVRYPEQETLGYESLERYVRAALPTSRRFVLLAESFSGPVAIRIAARPPAGLAGLILVSSFARFPLRCPGWAVPLAARLPVKSLPRWLRALLLAGSLDPRRVPVAAERSMANVSPAVIRHRIGELLRVDERPRLGDIALPVLVLAGRADRLIARRATRSLAALAHAQHVEIEGPHALLQGRPDLCADTVLQFLRRWI